MTHIGIIAGGTRGDVQPCIVLGGGLQDAGYEVTIVGGSNFKTWIEGHGLGYADIGVDIQEIMQGELGRAWVDSSPLTEIRNMKRAFLASASDLISGLVAALPLFDAVITGLTMMPITLPYTTAYDIPSINLQFTPAYPTRSGAATMIPVIPKRETFLNLVTRPAMLRVMWYTGSEAARMTAAHIRKQPLSYGEFARGWLDMPTIVAVSPTVVPPPTDFPPYVHVSGFLFLDQPTYEPPPELTAFLNAGEPPVYIGFGSMTGRDGGETLHLVKKAIGGQRALINRGWADVASDAVPENIFLLDDVPHDWLFDYVGAVVHHGGAGTTAAGLRAGAPTVVIPHMADQPYFGRRVHELGAGPKPLPRNRLTAHALGNAITQALTDTTIRERAATLGAQIREEDGLANAVALVGRYVPTPS